MSKILILTLFLSQITWIVSGFTEKAGVCPSGVSSYGACVVTCGSDDDCGGSKKCCNNGCGAWCSEATCPKGQKRVDCPSNLCTYVGCPGKDRSSLKCSVDFCNQCKVNFVNASTGDAVDCGPVETLCPRMRTASNSHLLGQYIPECDAQGAFKPVQCHEGYCFCVDKRGVPDMKTKVRFGRPRCFAKTPCQKQAEEANKKPPIGRFVPKCKADGSYQEKQCHASTGQCWCVDTYGREWFGTRSRGGSLDCIKSVCPSGITQLECDPLICHASKCPGFKDVSCRVNPCGQCKPEFLDKFNRPVKCLTPCQSLRNDALGLTKGSNVSTLVGRFVPQCTDDGSFEEIQCYASTGYCWCVDNKGSPIPGTAIRGRPQCKVSAVGGSMTVCQKKRNEALQGNGGLQPVGRFVPECDNSGKFETIQCWGSIGFCWCVDGVTGTEVAGTRVRGQPNCSNKPVSQTKPGYCPVKEPRIHAPYCKTTQRCSSDANCQGDDKCCNSTCGTICKKPIVTACSNSQPFMLCLHMCNFAKCPAHPDAKCFADPCRSCKIEFRDKNGDKVDCGKGLTPCQLRRQRAMGLLGAFKPQCDTSGNYKFVQNHEGYFWCVDSKGHEISGTKKRFTKPTCPNAGQSALTLCQLQSQQVAGGGLRVGQYKPQCNQDGSFKQVQCHPSTGYCWCVNTTSGVILPNTQKRGQPNCNRVCKPVLCRMYCEFGWAKDQYGCEICQCAPVPVKPGFCPSKSPISGKCKDKCSQDNDCPGSNKCCLTGCGKSCTSAVLKAKPGVCPHRPLDHAGACMMKCGDDADCHGDQKCCSNGCGRECSAPLRQACPYGQPLVMCLVNPCKNKICPSNPKAVCRPSYCGTCKAQFFDENNKVVDCNKGSTLCQQKYLEATSNGPLLGAFVPECAKDGSFKAMQCHGSTGYCWCVDTETGEKIPSTVRGPTEGLPSCKTSTPKPGPVCHLTNKLFSLCSSSTCKLANCTRNPRARCVVPMGTCDSVCKPKFYDYDGSEVQCLTECQQKRLEATQGGLLGAYKPTCNQDGTYTLIQCHPSTGYCWCSFPDGKEWPGTRARGQPKCLRGRSAPAIDKVNIKFTFKNDYSTIKENIEDFSRSMTNQLAERLGLKKEQVTNMSVTEGSVIVEFNAVPVDGGKEIDGLVEYVQDEVRQNGIVVYYAGMSFVASPQLVQASANYQSTDLSNNERGMGTTTIALICVFSALAVVIVGIIVVVVKKRQRRYRSGTCDSTGFIYREGRTESYSAVSS